MSERKVLNKYYPPDFDPSKIPRMKLSKNRQYTCTRCLQEISFKTDPKNTDYEIEAGATRNFMALKLAEEQAKREEEEQKEEEANNPMKLLEYRTEQSRQEIELLESLEELKELNRRQRSVDYDAMLQQYRPETAEERKKREQDEDDEFIKSVKFKHPSTSNTQKIVAEEIVEDVDEDDKGPPAKTPKVETVTKKIPPKKDNAWNKSIGVKKPILSNLVKCKKDVPSSTVSSTQVQSSSTTVQPSKSTDQSCSSNANTSEVKCTEERAPAPAATGLSLLAGYSGSDSDHSE